MTRPSLSTRAARDTICALATPPGTGSIAVIRVSGPDTFRVLDRLMPESRPSRQPAGTVRLGWIADKRGQQVDQVMIAAFRAPRSYSGEDMAEISCHGGQVAAGAILKLLTTSGCRPARPGEFTRRAVLSGKLTLAQAEALPDLVHAPGWSAFSSALDRYRGATARTLRGLATRLRTLWTELEYCLGFEDVPAPARLRPRLGALIREMDRTLAGAERDRLLNRGAVVAIIGRPNVGKSSLFNRLLGEERALVTPVSGTTRDRIEARLILNEIPLTLVDTCGLGVSAGDRLTRLGAVQTRRAVANADLLLAVFDGSRPASDSDRQLVEKTRNRPTIMVINKTDRPRRFHLASVNGGSIPVSCRTGTGIALLRRRLALRARPGPAADTMELALLRESRQALARALEAPDLERCELELRAALAALDGTENYCADPQLLDRIFARFCVGK
ncbi:MAG: tRNA modification GTPase [candidate division WOR-3 bacterium]